jgi:hypothetical protein
MALSSTVQSAWQCYVMRNFGTYFTGTVIILAKGPINEAGKCSSPDATRKCILHNFVRYRNIRSRDPITLLSMDIVFETFLEIGVSDLLVLTRRLQDPLHRTMKHTYLSLSIGLGKRNFMISHDISLIMFSVSHRLHGDR